MQELGYGRGYRYDFDEETHHAPQEYMPEAVGDGAFYEPSRFGFEKRIAERLRWWEEQRQRETE